MEQPKKKITPVTPTQLSLKKNTPTQLINSRRTDELVIALCGAVGAGVSTVAREVKKVLELRGYETRTIKISTLIESFPGTAAHGENTFERTESLQTTGNQLRKQYGNDILAQLAIRDISGHRSESTIENNQESDNYAEDSLKKRRHATIIDSLKNPDEVELFKKVYSNMFYLFGVLCNDTLRKKRLKLKGSMSETDALQLMEKDKIDKEDYGQQLLKTLQHADFFTRNNRPNTDSLVKPITRFIDLMLGQNNITPTINEFGMYIAESAARRSGCISRQVGAAILTPPGDIISTGRNDVPKPLGGLYGEDDGIDDCRCFKVHDKACSNEKNKRDIFHNIEQIIKNTLTASEDSEKISAISAEIQANSEIKDLLEYSKAVHAEMDAITSAARIGHFPLKGTILFSTTFPCHHCARHIVASGIKKVYYIEPYEKSLATKLHDDAIELNSQDDENDSKKVIFSHFEGVAPKQYLHLFSCNNRKKDGKLNTIKLTSKYPTVTSYLDTFLDYESKVTELVDDLFGKMGESGNGN